MAKKYLAMTYQRIREKLGIRKGRFQDIILFPNNSIGLLHSDDVSGWGRLGPIGAPRVAERVTIDLIGSLCPWAILAGAGGMSTKR